MSLLSRLESKFGRFAVPNLTVALIAGQVAVYVLSNIELPGGSLDLGRLALVPALVLEGQVWRLVSFLFMPPTSNILFAFLYWWAFYVCGTILERVWGTFRYNIYLLVGYIATVAVAFLYPEVPATNYFLKATVFLAFARLNPDFVFNLYGILPVKSKWLALFIWAFLAHSFWLGPWPMRLAVLATIANYLLFFGRGIWRDAKDYRRRMQFKARSLHGQGLRGRSRLSHECHVCGLTSAKSPKTQFRYCSQCGGDYCYCPDHLQNHDHVKTAPSEATPSS